jgi:hypothetical protein
MEKQLTCQYVFTNAGKKGEKCNKPIRQQTNKNVFENGCYCSVHVQQRKLYNPDKINVGRPKKDKTIPVKNLQLTTFNFETMQWDVQTTLTEDEVVEKLSTYSKYHIKKIIKFGSMKIYPHIKVTKINNNDDNNNT